MHVITIVDIHPDPKLRVRAGEPRVHMSHVICTCGAIYNMEFSKLAVDTAKYHNDTQHGKDSPYKIVRIS